MHKNGKKMHKYKLLQIVTKNYKIVTKWKHRPLSQAAPRVGRLNNYTLLLYIFAYYKKPLKVLFSFKGFDFLNFRFKPIKKGFSFVAATNL